MSFPLTDITRLRSTGDNLKHLAGVLETAHATLKDVKSDYVRQRARAESEPDRTLRGAFRFGDVTQGIELADRTYDLPYRTVLSGCHAEGAAVAMLTEEPAPER